MIEMGVFGYFRKSLASFATSTRVFREVIKTPVSSLEVVTSSSLMLCRSKNAEKKRKSELLIHLYIDIHYINVPTSITIIKMKVECKLTNHIY